MSDNLSDDAFEDDSFDEFDGNKKGRSLGDLWRESPAFKVGVVVAAAVVVFGAIAMMGGQSQAPSQSMVPSGSEISAPPGTQEASPAYREAVQEQNQARVESAIRDGQSALPTPVETPVGRLSVPEEQPAQEDPLQRWRQMQEERLQREMVNRERQVAAAPAPNQEDTTRAQTLQAMTDSMAQQMQSILDNHSQPTQIKKIDLTDPKWLEEQRRLEQQNVQAAEAAKQAELDPDIILAPAGQIYYAQIITEANNKVPGPVLAEIMSGPLRGSRILGDFDEQDETLTLNFKTVVVDGESISADGVALDPGTTLPGMATDVDHHYLRRIILPAAAAFVEGLGNAISESGRTNITITGETVAEETNDASNDQEVASGVEEAAQEVRDILDEENEDTRPTIRIESGTPFGLLFLEPVIKRSEDATVQGQNTNPYFPGYGNMGPVPGAGYSGGYPGGYMVPYGSSLIPGAAQQQGGAAQTNTPSGR